MVVGTITQITITQVRKSFVVNIKTKSVLQIKAKFAQRQTTQKAHTTHITQKEQTKNLIHRTGSADLSWRTVSSWNWLVDNTNHLHTRSNNTNKFHHTNTLLNHTVEAVGCSTIVPQATIAMLVSRSNHMSLGRLSLTHTSGQKHMHNQPHQDTSKATTLSSRHNIRNNYTLCGCITILF